MIDREDSGAGNRPPLDSLHCDDLVNGGWRGWNRGRHGGLRGGLHGSVTIKSDGKQNIQE